MGESVLAFKDVVASFVGDASTGDCMNTSP